ncbi:MAG TPA: HAD-IA family hydrolase, partial [Candidatus Obscuribacterales bacterium]
RLLRLGALKCESQETNPHSVRARFRQGAIMVTHSPLRKALSWGVHFYTGLGLICAAAMALLIVDGSPEALKWAFIAMFVATLIDATDGTMARALKVKEVLPGFDGRRLDDIIDFQTYTSLPLLLVWRAGILPGEWALCLIPALMASAYGFCQTKAKTDDGYFLGFPSYWNVVAFYLYVLPAPPAVCAAIVLGLALLTFVPTRYLYPSQGGTLNLVTNVLSVVWCALLVWIVMRMGAGGDIKTLSLVSLFFPLYYMAASFAVEAKVRFAQRRTALDAVIFDMDGTLTDSEPLHHQAYQKVIAAWKAVFTEAEYDQFTGATDMAIAAYLIQKHNLPLSARDLIAAKEKEFVLIAREKSVLRPGVLQTLETIKDMGLRMAVASSAMLDGIHAVLDCLGIKHYFDVIASGEEVSNSKPHPDVFLLAARRLGADPRRCLVFEDSRNGVLAAKAAKMRCIAVPCPSTAGQNHGEADLKVDSFEDLPDLRSLLTCARS